MLTQAQGNIVRETFAIVESMTDTAADMIYSRLFEIQPHWMKSFKGGMRDQGRNLIAMLKTGVNALHQPKAVAPFFKALGARHTQYGVYPQDYRELADSFLWMLPLILQHDYNDTAREAWEVFFADMIQAMAQGARESGVSNVYLMAPAQPRSRQRSHTTKKAV